MFKLLYVRNVGCSGCATLEMCEVWDAGFFGDVGCWDVRCENAQYSGYGMIQMLDVRDVGCWGCQMFGIWDAQDVGCLGYGIFEMWEVLDVGIMRCSRCVMFEI